MSRIIDEEYEHGPKTVRSCTDSLCYFLLLSILLYSGVNYHNLKNRSDLSKFVTPVDYFGTVCGKNEAKDYPFLMLPRSSLGVEGHGTLNPIKSSVCVSSCQGAPNWKNEANTCLQNPSNSNDWCLSNLNGDQALNFNLYLGKFCIQDGIQTETKKKHKKESNITNDEFKKDNKQEGTHSHEDSSFNYQFKSIPALQNFVSNPLNYYSILKVVLVSIVISQILIIVMSKFTFMVTLSIILGYFSISFFALFKLKTTISHYEHRNTSEMNKHDSTKFKHSIEYLYWVFYGLIGVIACSALVLVCFWKKIRVAVSCVKASGKYTSGNISSVLVSLLTGSVYLYIFYATTLYMARKIQADGNEYFDNSLPFMSYSIEGST
jgi:uncharacterized membrane protein